MVKKVKNFIRLLMQVDKEYKFNWNNNGQKYIYMCGKVINKFMTTKIKLIIKVN